MKEVQIEKVENGYLVRCHGINERNSFVYVTLTAAIEKVRKHLESDD